MENLNEFITVSGGFFPTPTKSSCVFREVVEFDDDCNKQQGQSRQ
jgi:hypothetical protein